MLAASVACAQTPAEIKARGKLVVGVMVDVPPYAILNEDNKPDGYDADIAKLLAKRMGVPLDMVVVTGPNRIPYLLTGKVDMLVAVLGIIPERSKLVLFSEPYSGFSQFVWAPKSAKVTGPADLKGMTIGVPRANTADISLSKIVPPGTNILRFDDDASVRQALAAGQVDVVTASTTSIPAMERLTGKGKYERKFDLNTQVEGVAVRPSATELLAWVNEAISAWKADRTIEKINDKWVGAPLPDLKMPTQ
ncbi:MAG TPA: transporter substrate-binding domain-containing protein [Acetobacteraceae bacterium]|jgi:polar amino acid transport system substrate-binding protein|nr:transporter substrate-binding domain-containing protein [Acetobacteraceae bacterium]